MTHSEFIFQAGIRSVYRFLIFFFLHVDVQLCPRRLLESLVLLGSIPVLWLLCQRSADCIQEGLSLGSLFRSSCLLFHRHHTVWAPGASEPDGVSLSPACCSFHSCVSYPGAFASARKLENPFATAIK